MKSVISALCVCLLLLSQGCDRQDTPRSSVVVDISTPDSFLKYINPQDSLPAGQYKVVAATSTAGVSGSFTLNVTGDDGVVRTYAGNWSGSGGQDPLSTANPAYTITLKRAGGLTIELHSSVDAYVYLLDRTDRVVAEDNDSGSGTDARIELAKSKIDTSAYAQAYYAAIDPNNERDTFSKWRSANGFDTDPNVVHVVFRDTKDLGYGRDMYVRHGQNGCAYFYVRNYVVNVIPGLPYNTLNLIAAVEKDKQHHFGTNAIEFSDRDNNCDGSEPLFAKFYTFTSAAGNGGTEQRLLTTDLDGRGKKAMPGTCVVCHGGTTRPLLPDGSFPSGALPGASTGEYDLRRGDTHAKLQPLEVDTFEYSDVSGDTRADQEARLKQINEIVYDTYPSFVPTSPTTGEWTGINIREVMDGWYGGDIKDPANTTFDPSYVPPAWQYDPTDNLPPPGSDELFVKVIKPYCLTCHSKRGSDLGINTGGSLTQDIDFSSYDKFISYAAQIEDYVYDRGVMPLSLVNYQAFWNSDAPDILASFLPGFSHANADGSIDPPGKPVSRPGLSYTTTSPVQLNGSASLFASTYSWSVVNAPAGSRYSIDKPDDVAPVLTADMNGSYDVQLIVGNGIEQSQPQTITLTIDSSMTPAPADLTFDTDIQPFMALICATGCHQSAVDNPSTTAVEAGVPGVPLYYDAPSNGLSIYQNVRQRINFKNPADSLLLLKPTGNHHYGASPLTGSDYDKFVNWIMHGAREN